jgi:hypothetical protein
MRDRRNFNTAVDENEMMGLMGLKRRTPKNQNQSRAKVTEIRQ